MGTAPKSPLILLPLILLLTAVIAYLDYITGPEISFGIFYLLPVYLASWYAGRAAGVFIAATGAVLWLAANFAWQREVSSSLVPYWNAAVLFGIYLITALLIARLQTALWRERENSRVDYLTGVATRRAFHDVAEMEKNRARRYHHPLTLAYLDIDNFKRINDTLGHAAGDEVLKSVGQALREHLRDTDYVARMGGDEFTILLPETEEKAGEFVLAKLHTVLRRLGSTFPLPVTFSIGAVTFRAEPESFDQMMQEADRVMYKAKRNGKDRVTHEVVGA